MSYIRQLKTVLWKNRKYFNNFLKKYFVIFIIELVLTIVVISTLSKYKVEEIYYDNVSSSNLKNLTNSVDDFAYHQHSNLLGLVFPKNQPKEVNDILISNIMNDPLITNTNHNNKDDFQKIQHRIFESEDEFLDYVQKDKTGSFLVCYFHDNYMDYTIKLKVPMLLIQDYQLLVIMQK
ncbi:hypothetical protein BCR32DRAFT_143368 [Anaeromyces robustus]|uniref:Uncharacterized protein n=1 Tax=Anaeromyces robustus TaxID=1754192 RepID=A0A1Y1VQI5_9FUNG|nr:hypothetical protein BCR32DRAFT_143368 [Anaeromyces robustus]|eukprot:ORX63286.1 hypothetical protein BCR32DRAFT_143368 [Anaeromyces robustus]